MVTAFQKILVMILLILPTLTSATPEAQLEITDEANSQVVKEIAESLTQARERVIRSEKNSRKILGRLYEINHKIKKMSAKRTKVSHQMYSTKGSASALARTIVKLEERSHQQSHLLSRRLRRLYKMGKQGSLQVLFSAQSASDLDKNLVYLKKLTDRDYELINNHEENLKKLKVSRARLKTNVHRLVGLERQLKAQEKSLEKQLNSKSRLLTQLRSSRNSDLQKIKGLRKMADGMRKDSELAIFMKETFFEKKGRLPRPAIGVITKPFGLDQDDKFKFKLNHKGIFLATRAGEPVHAVFGGKVSFAGNIDGYGKSVIINHGDHYYTVYCHNQDLKVKKGQNVAEGERVGNAGVDPFGRVGLYFEIRHFSDPVDPQLWVSWAPKRQKTRL